MLNNLGFMIVGNEEILIKALTIYWFNDSWIRGFELVTRGFELVTRGFELVTCGFELVTCGFELVTCGFGLVTGGFELVTGGFEFQLVTLVLPYHFRKL